MIKSDFPLGLYIHIPWCVRKCPYCDFNSHEFREVESSGKGLPKQLEKDYLNCLKVDLQTEISRLRQIRSPSNRDSEPKLRSIFIGGGTPSLCSPDFYHELLDYIRSVAHLSDDSEVTLEANPGTADAGYFKGYHQAGINRLSMGVQSFNEDALSALGRIHSGDDACKAFMLARKAGFQNINLDIMHGLPNQSTVDAMNDLRAAIELRPEHLSWYQLTIEKNTAFYSDPPLIPQDLTLAEIESGGYEMLAEQGYQRYEVSAFALEGNACTHNLNYWSFGDYLAVGAGAHGKISGPDSILRRWKTRMPKDYMASINFLAGEKSIPVEERALEYLMNALRLTEGFSIRSFEARSGLSFEVVEGSFVELKSNGLVEQLDDRVRLTPLGFRFLDEVLARF